MKFSKINYGMIAMLAKTAESQQEAPCSSDDMVVFGDSYSDTGNLFALTEGELPPGPPYTDGRFTNGNVWVEYLADLMKLNPPAPFYSANPAKPAGGTNYAIAGAASGSDETISWIPALFGLPAILPGRGVRLQINDFLVNCGIVSCCSSKMLFVIFVGANDFGLLGKGPEYMDIIGNISASIEDLIDKAGATEIIVLNLPQIASSPAAVGTYKSLFVNEILPDGLMESVEMYNEGLAEELTNLDAQYEDVNIIHADIAPIMNEAASNPAKFGLDDTKDTGIPTLDETAVFKRGSLEYLNAENALYFDGVHPTTTFHEVLAKEVHGIVKKSRRFKGSKTSKSSSKSRERSNGRK